MEFNLSNILLIITMLVYLALYYFIWSNDRFVRNQQIKHLTFLFYIALAFFVGVYIFESKTMTIDSTVVTIFLSVFVFMFTVNIIIFTFFSSWDNNKTTSRQKVVILFLDLSSIFFLFSFIHYLLYWNISDSFAFSQKGEGWFDIAINFIYYSFSTSITYSAGGIEPESSLAKIFSMLQIGFFYLVLGESIFGELQNKREQ